MFQFGLVPTTNVPTRITKETISDIDHITNSIINNECKTVDISDHFSIIYDFKLKMNPKTQFLYKRINKRYTNADLKIFRVCIKIIP